MSMMASNYMGRTQKDERPLNEVQKEVASKLQASFEILNKYRSQLKRVSGVESSQQSTRQSSATRIMKTAIRMKQLHSTSQQHRNIFALADTSEIESCLSHDNAKHLKLAMSLLDAAEYFSKKQYHEAENSLTSVLLDSCGDHAVERVVAYLAKDLKERINQEKGDIDLEREVVNVDVHEALFELKSTIPIFEQKLPLQISHFTAIQTILDSAGSAKRIHFIDFGMKLYSHWTIMMHALADRNDFPLEQLKITAVCTSKDITEEKNKNLTSYAESINLPFVYKTLNLEMNELKKDQFELEDGEEVVVYMELCLTQLSGFQEKIEALIKEIKKLNPHVMVVDEAEADVGGLTFIDRFHRVVVHCSVVFDCLEVCLGRENQCKDIYEKLYFQERIRDYLMADQDEETFKLCCKIDFRREYFGRFGILETELSQLSMYQATLLLNESACWRSYCSLSMNGKSMLVCWNGVPLRSVSAWKFQHE